MDWKDVGRSVASFAPLAGSILGGLFPIPGGAIIGKKFGEIIAQKFGLPATATPGEVNTAIATAGEETKRANINAAMEQARAEIAGFVEIEKAYTEALMRVALGTQETMRAEDANRVQLALAGKREHWFFTGWRPFIGWVFGVVALSFGLMLVAATARAAWLSPDPLKTLADAWPIFATYFGVLGAAVGVLIKGRSDEKAAAIVSAAPMPNAKPMPVPVPSPGQKIKDAVATRTPAGKSGIIPLPPGDRT